MDDQFAKKKTHYQDFKKKKFQKGREKESRGYSETHFKGKKTTLCVKRGSGSRMQ